MNGASKILTVSYGTFSCTLEGFDEPFNTMKAIAEYFRDLASGDRYFGAEPPTPDAEMLHRIAEREIHRRVEAKIQENGVILRAGEIDLPQTIAKAPALVTPEMPVVVARAPEPAQPAAPPAAPIATPRVTEAIPAAESAALRLSKLRAAQAATHAVNTDAAPDHRFTPAAVVQAPFRADADLYIEDQHAIEELADLADLAALDESPAHLEDRFVAQSTIDAPDAELMAEIAGEDDIDAAAPTAETVDDLLPEDDDITEYAAETVAEVVPDEFDDFSVDDEADLLQSLNAQTRSDVAEAAVYNEPDAAGLADEAADLDETFKVSALQSDDFDMPHEDDLLAEDFTNQASEMLADEDFADENEDWTAEPAAVEFADEVEFEPAATQQDAPVAAQAEPEPVAEEQSAHPGIAEKLQRARARVIKIRRADAPAMIDGRPSKTAANETASVESRPLVLTPEAEDDLQRELAALQAEATPAPVVDTKPETVETEPRLVVVKHQMPESGEESVSRLIAHANSELAGPEIKRRLSAIAHLKAAVNATLADRRVNPSSNGSATQRMDPYRDDLDRVMHPDRPAGLPEGSANKPAPLVLVSEQRIDRSKGEPVSAEAAPLSNLPVRPRRVTTGAVAVQPVRSALHDEDQDDASDELSAEDLENIFSDSKAESFGDFAERLGATAMPDLLEAAGAYCSTILGRPNFSRPLLLAQLSRLPDAEEITREESMRGFGSLLRDGRITKIRRGQFQLSDKSRYLAEARRIAG